MIKKLPKIELHCHLDGSITENFLKKYVKDYKLDDFKAPKVCNSLKSYLCCFDNILPYLQTKEELQFASYEFIKEVKNDNVIYVEVRFAPCLHTRKNLTQQEVVNIIYNSLKKAAEEFNVKFSIILCFMRGVSEEVNLETLNVGLNNLDKINAFDIAGDELSYKPEKYKYLFDVLKSKKIPFTMHAGECGDYNNVITSINMGAKRIGHGIATINSEEAICLCKEKDICLELCYTSNIQTKAILNKKLFPFNKFKKLGINISLSTDNRMVSSTTLNNEWENLINDFNDIDIKDIYYTNLASIKKAFISDEEKEELKNIYIKEFKNVCKL